MKKTEIICNHVHVNGCNKWSMLVSTLNMTIKEIKIFFNDIIRVDEEWSEAEIKLLKHKVKKYGKRFSRIKVFLPGRSSEDCQRMYNAYETKKKERELSEMENNQTKVYGKREARKHKTHNLEDYEDIWEELSSELSRNRLTLISKDIKVAEQTVSDWHQKLLRNEIPLIGEALNISRMFSKCEEDAIFNTILEKLDKGIIKKDIATIAQTYRNTNLYSIAWRYFSSKGFTDQTVENLLNSKEDYQIENLLPCFKSSYSWIDGFCSRYDFSLLTPHAERRGVIDMIYVGYYLSKLKSASTTYGDDHIFNMDETSVPFFIPPRRVIGIRGQSETHYEIPCNKKSCFTVMATISKNGSKLPPWIVEMGKTKFVENKFAEFNENQFITSHTKNGWVTEEVMLDYLYWLSEYNGGCSCLLIMDVFRAHKTELIKRTARELLIDLLFVPANGTGIYQMLDRKIFGPLKKKLCMSCHQWQMSEGRLNLSQMKLNAARMFDVVWRSFPQENIVNSFVEITNL